MAITMLDPRAVVVPARLRPEDPARTAALIPSVRRDGVRSPIEVREVGGRAVLIAGLHRLRAALGAELPAIPAIFKVATDDEAELLEIEENLIRHDLNALDRSVFVARWKDVYERLYPESTRRGRRAQMDQAWAISFSRSDEAKKIGLSATSIKRNALRIKRLAPDVVPLLRGTDAEQKGTVLDALCALDHDTQRLVAEMVAHGTARTIAGALRLHRKAADVPQTDDERAANALLGAWTRNTSPAARRRFFRALAAAADLLPWLPAGFGRTGADDAKPAAARGTSRKKDTP